MYFYILYQYSISLLQRVARTNLQWYHEENIHVHAESSHSLKHRTLGYFNTVSILIYPWTFGEVPEHKIVNITYLYRISK